MKWIVGIIVVAVLAWLVFSQLRRRQDDPESASAEARRKLEAGEGGRHVPGSEGFGEEWENIIEHSPEARDAYERLHPFGQTALERLLEHHREHQAPEQLPEVAEQIARDFEKSSGEDKN